MKAVSRGALIATVVALALLAGVAPGREEIQTFLARPGALVQGQPLWLQAFESASSWGTGTTARSIAAGSGVSTRCITRRSISIGSPPCGCTRSTTWSRGWRRRSRSCSSASAGNPCRLPAVPRVLRGRGARQRAVDLGSFRHLIASPTFHRWHHALPEEPEASGARRSGVNFAGLFPFLDLAFGTFHLPRRVVPLRFGASEPVPEGLPAQLAYPFRRSPATGRFAR